jgi:hypothetical protein
MAKQITYHGKYKGIIVSQFSVNKIRKELEKRKKEIEDFLIFRFQQIGEECVKIAREKGSYNDITGNLRSSIGYVVLDNGKPVVYGKPEQRAGRGENMQLVTFKDKNTGKQVRYWAKGKHGDGAEGVKAAETLLTMLQAKYPRGIVLIVCAGMNYAAYVENIHHKDVLASAEQEAERLVKQLLKGIIKQ